MTLLQALIDNLTPKSTDARYVYLIKWLMVGISLTGLVLDIVGLLLDVNLPYSMFLMVNIPLVFCILILEYRQHDKS